MGILSLSGGGNEAAVRPTLAGGTRGGPLPLAAGWGQVRRPLAVPLATQGAPAAVPDTGTQANGIKGTRDTVFQ